MPYYRRDITGSLHATMPLQLLAAPPDTRLRLLLVRSIKIQIMFYSFLHSLCKRLWTCLFNICPPAIFFLTGKLSSFHSSKKVFCRRMQGGRIVLEVAAGYERPLKKCAAFLQREAGNYLLSLCSLPWGLHLLLRLRLWPIWRFVYPSGWGGQTCAWRWKTR